MSLLKRAQFLVLVYEKFGNADELVKMRVCFEAHPPTDERDHTQRVEYRKVKTFK